jgi:two-component system, OmpR family, response regulator MtrA
MTATLLLIEDDGRVRQTPGLALTDVGYRVPEAATGEQALQRAGRWTAGTGRGAAGGLVVCSAIRDQGDLPIIIVTARSDTADVIAGLKAGADDYVTEPLAVPFSP